MYKITNDLFVKTLKKFGSTPVNIIYNYKTIFKYDSWVVKFNCEIIFETIG